MKGASTIKRGEMVSELSLPGSAQKTNATAEARTKEGHYRPLPKEFRHHGFDYRQIARERDAAIYEQIWNGCSDPSIAYEVVRIRRRDGFEIAGRFVAPSEVYANSEAWGVDGFTFTNRDAATAKLPELLCVPDAFNHVQALLPTCTRIESQIFTRTQNGTKKQNRN